MCRPFQVVEWNGKSAVSVKHCSDERDPTPGRFPQFRRNSSRRGTNTPKPLITWNTLCVSTTTAILPLTETTSTFRNPPAHPPALRGTFLKTNPMPMKHPRRWPSLSSRRGKRFLLNCLRKLPTSCCRADANRCPFRNRPSLRQPWYQTSTPSTVASSANNCSSFKKPKKWRKILGLTQPPQESPNEWVIDTDSSRDTTVGERIDPRVNLGWSQPWTQQNHLCEPISCGSSLSTPSIYPS